MYSIIKNGDITSIRRPNFLLIQMNLEKQMNVFNKHDIYKGDLPIFKGGTSSKLLNSIIKSNLYELFPESSSPEVASFSLGGDEVMRRIDNFSKKIFQNCFVRRCSVAVISEIGIDPYSIILDTPRIRCVPNLSMDEPLPVLMYGAHRDTWYGEPQCQINVWIPIYDVDESKSFEFYPDYFGSPIVNSSDTFNLNVEIDPKTCTNSHPVPLENILGSRYKFSAAAGDNLLFSAAHLHGTTRNSSGLDRYALQFRLVYKRDMVDGYGAPNVDNRSTGSTAIFMHPVESWITAGTS